MRLKYSLFSRGQCAQKETRSPILVATDLVIPWLEVHTVVCDVAVTRLLMRKVRKDVRTTGAPTSVGGRLTTHLYWSAIISAIEDAAIVIRTFTITGLRVHRLSASVSIIVTWRKVERVT